MPKLHLALFAAACCLMLFFGVTAAASPQQEPPIRVAFIDPAEPESVFWREFIGAMRAAAADLGILLDVYPSHHWPTKTINFVEALLQGQDKPDYLIITNHRGVAAPVFQAAEQAKVPSFLVDTGLQESDQRRYGGPRAHFKYWLGQMLPDNVQAGYVLANHLIAEDLRRGGGKARMIAIGGQPVDLAAVERAEGLRQAIAERANAQLLQLVPSNWSAQQGKDKTIRLFRRYPDASVVWAANATIGIGSLEALQLVQPKHSALIGWIDWLPQVIPPLRSGALSIAVGGHTVLGAWSMVLLYDYHHGHDFAEEKVTWQTEMRPVTRQNMKRYLPILKGDWEEINFRKFSKAYHPELRRYPFSLEALLSKPERHSLEACSP